MTPIEEVVPWKSTVNIVVWVYIVNHLKNAPSISVRESILIYTIRKIMSLLIVVRVGEKYH